MKTKSIKVLNGLTAYVFLMVFSCFYSNKLAAQTVVGASTSTITVLDNYNLMYVELKGGDGGKKGTKLGGQGVSITGHLKIGNQDSEVAPNGKLRFIPGGKGLEGGGGGGGTALVYQAPGASEWIILAVAGGGGGATVTIYEPSNDYADNQESNKADGSPATTSNNGTKAGTSSGNHFGGGSAYNAAGNNKCAGQPGMQNGKPTRAEVDADCDAKGGAGFGSGGAGVQKDGAADAYYGGGGGGYSGGNGSKYNNGGGSYYNADYFETVTAVPNGTTGSPENGYIRYEYLRNSEIKLASAPTSKCATNKGGKLNQGNNIHLFDCKTGVKSQDWSFKDNQIQLVYSRDKCMDVSEGKTSNGTNVQLWNCWKPTPIIIVPNPNQVWIYDGRTKQFRSRLNLDKCLNDAYGGRTDNATNIMLWDCGSNGGKADQWEVEGTTTANDQTKVQFIVPYHAQGFAVHSHTYTAVGSNIQLWTNTSTNAAEKWYFDGVKLKLKSHPNLCIDIKNNNTSNGSNLHLWNCNSKKTQQWVYDGLTRSIRSGADHNKCVQVKDGNYNKRANIELWTCNGSKQQEFALKE